MNRIETKDLSICYDDHLVVDSLNLSIPEGKPLAELSKNKKAWFI
jgi:ABC-type cobalamin/Fe3+-siderophores transport system ATPase subunit